MRDRDLFAELDAEGARIHAVVREQRRLALGDDVLTLMDAATAADTAAQRAASDRELERCAALREFADTEKPQTGS